MKLAFAGPLTLVLVVCGVVAGCAPQAAGPSQSETLTPTATAASGQSSTDAELETAATGQYLAYHDAMARFVEDAAGAEADVRELVSESYFVVAESTAAVMRQEGVTVRGAPRFLDIQLTGRTDSTATFVACIDMSGVESKEADGRLRPPMFEDSVVAGKIEYVFDGTNLLLAADEVVGGSDSELCANR